MRFPLEKEMRARHVVAAVTRLRHGASFDMRCSREQDLQAAKTKKSNASNRVGGSFFGFARRASRVDQSYAKKCLNIFYNNLKIKMVSCKHFFFL